MKKVIGIILAVIVLTLGIYLLVKYLQSKKEPYGTFILPRLEWSRFVVKEIDPQKIALDFEMILDNPMPTGFKVDSFTYDFTIASEVLFTETYPKSIEFKGNDSSLVELPVTIYLKKLKRVLDSLDMSEADSADYGFRGYFYANVPLVEKRKFAYDHGFKAPLYKVPVTQIRDWKLEKLKFNESRIVFDLFIHNRNVFPYEFKNLEYKIDLGNEMVFEGAVKQEIIVEAQDSLTIALPVEVDNSELLSALWDYIRKGDDIDYKFWSRLQHISKNNTIRDSPLIIKAEGNLSELKEP